ncbi:MAG: DUF4395 family protein [Candidatus Magasanikbacteria bacterium]
MKQCIIYDESLRFARAVYGLLTLLSFFIQNYWLILAVCIMLALGAITIKLNLPYQFHVLVLRRLHKNVAEPIQKEVAELNFVSGMTGVFLLVGFLLLYFEKFVDFAWILILITALLIFLACFAGFCVASLTYALYKKVFKK